jgi:primosomal protein N' (replication factor Y)
VLLVKEELKEGFKVLEEDFLVLSNDFVDDMEKALNLVERSEKQTRAVLSYFALSKKLKKIPKKAVYEMASVNSQVVNAIAKKGIWDIEKREVSRIGLFDEPSVVKLSPLAPTQVKTMHEIQKIHEERKVALLHGVTGSGKTRIYIELMKEVLDQGGQVLYLLPEIALTSQIVSRLSKQLGAHMWMYHSQINDHQRVEIWNAAMVKSGLYIGARSEQGPRSFCPSTISNSSLLMKSTILPISKTIQTPGIRQGTLRSF